MADKSTPLLPGFPHRLGRPRKSIKKTVAQEIDRARSKSLDGLREMFGSWLDLSLLSPPKEGEGSRARVFSFEVTFWAYVYQLLSGCVCAGAVKRVQSWMRQRKRPVPSSNTSAYCQARARLPLKLLRDLFSSSLNRVSRLNDDELWHGRRVKVVDATGLSMPDTEENQQQWPQNSNSKPGCGFPQMKVVGLFCLATGLLLDWREGNKRQHETTLWRKMICALTPGDVIVGDRAYGYYAGLAELIQHQTDGVFRLTQGKKVDWRKGKKLGDRDRVQVWQRPNVRGRNWTKEDWQEVPHQLTVRVIHRRLQIPGFRTKHITIVTSLLDAEEYPAEDILELYHQRWKIELYFRDIKTTLGMDELSSKSPEQVRKEFLMYAICHNLLRSLILQTARTQSLHIGQVSFSDATATMREYLYLAMSAPISHAQLVQHSCRTLGTKLVPFRPNRSEPRVRKRRPKNFRLMTERRDARKTPASNTFGTLS